MGKYGKVSHTGLGTIDFTVPPHIENVIDAFVSCRLIVILKARQIYMTWTMAGLALWEALFKPSARVILLSKKEDAAAETLDYARFIHTNLPDFLKKERGKDNDTLMTFPLMNSKIRALSTTEESGIGFGQASLIIADEWDFHEYAERNYAEIKPMTDKGGKFIALSAPNKYNADTKFKEIWYGAKAKENNFHPIFVPYDVLPERDETWYNQQSREYDKWELEGRYPRTEEEALSAPQLVCRFDNESLARMDDIARLIPILEKERNGIVRIWMKPDATRRYILAVDPSEGEYDPCSGIVIEWRKCTKVADFSGFLTVDEQASIVYDLYERYNSPYSIIERNCGIPVIERVMEMGLSNLYKTNKDKPGWWTSSANRSPMISDVDEGIRHGLVVEPAQDARSQFRAFIRTKKKPDGEARKGCHDDFVICWGMALQGRKNMPIKVKPIQMYKMREY